MGLIDDLAADVEPAELTRRKVLGVVTGSTLALAGVGTIITAVSYLRPNVLFEPATKFKVGRPENIQIGTLLVLPVQRLYVVHAERGFVALSAVCTHLGCMTRYLPPDKRIVCPCHGSMFDREGTVVGGPAPRPLERRHLEIVDGDLWVDGGRVAADDFVLEVGA